MNDLTEHRSLYRNRSEEAEATESQKTEDSLKLSKNVKLFKKENKWKVFKQEYCLLLNLYFDLNQNCQTATRITSQVKTHPPTNVNMTLSVAS